MSIPPPLSRRSSTWSILRALDAHSPSPSWTSLDHFTACCVGDLQNLINGTCSNDDSGPMDSFNLAYKGVPISDDNTGAEFIESCIRHKPPKQLSASAIHLMKDPPQVMLNPRPQSTAFPPVVQEVPSDLLSTPESSHKGSVHATSDYSSTSCFCLLGIFPPSPGIGTLSGPQGLSGHRRNGSASTTDSGLSARSNPLLIAHDANHIIPENAGLGVVRFPLLAVSLSWLQSTTLEVMIDQEGFRMIKPNFKLAGYAPRSEVGLHLVSATADFMPSQRKSFSFHHSELETPPVLRRLMLNGDESRDYLSRQAFLTLKANGPYTVQGTEPVHSSDLFPATLSWRFDYLVGDRRTEAGRIIPGEKTFTPLSFSCSPALLLPTQGKKIRVMHVVKKSVTAKLTAMKIEPPRPPPPYLVPGAPPPADAEFELRGAVTGKHRSNAPQVSPRLSTSTYDSAQVDRPVHSSPEAFPPLTEPLRSPKTRIGTRRADRISTLFHIDTSHVVDE
ncbi:hypothetical protein BJV77DRAFT_970066 [Russula vinacea]|nr:hypothetical protein BJV77DRAFT_970066 [Russula vinacea]